MSKFLTYLAEAEYAAENPIPGDSMDFEFGLDDVLVATTVSEITEDGDIIIEATAQSMLLLETHGLILEDVMNQSAADIGPELDSTSPIRGANFLPYERKQDPRKWFRNDVTSQEEDEAEQKDKIKEAKYHGQEVPLGKKMAGDVKKSKVYVRDPSTGNIKKVNFGDKTMRIKKSNPARRKSFRARHNCDNPGPRTKARYWSCRSW